MDWSKLNPIEWIKEILKGLEQIKYCYFFGYLFVYICLLIVPTNISHKLDLFRYISLLTIVAIVSITILFARIINYFSLKIETFLQERKILEYLNTLNVDESNAMCMAVKNRQQTIYMNFQDSAGVSLLQKGLIVKCDGEQTYEGHWPYIVPNFVWKKIRNDKNFDTELIVKTNDFTVRIG